MSQNIVVLAVDGLRASALGAYGNAWVPTPALDHLAAQCTLCDWWFAESSEHPAVMRALWQSRRPRSLAASLAACGSATCLITDDPKVADSENSQDFEERIVLDEPPLAIAENAADTGFGRILSEAAVQIESSNAAQPRLTWIQTRGFYGPWDATQEIREAMAQVDQSEPSDIVVPPDFVVTDPDPAAEIFPVQAAYAAQVMLLDQCLEAFLELLDENAEGDDTLFILIGVRGFPLGEHGKIGGVDGRLYVEQLHVPCLFRDTSRRFPPMARVASLLQHVDLASSISDWMTGKSIASKDFGGASLLSMLDDPRGPRGDRVVSADSSGSRSLRTANWCLRTDSLLSNDDRPAAELYVRPDDLWEANDVAALCPEIVQELTASLESTDQSTPAARC